MTVFERIQSSIQSDIPPSFLLWSIDHDIHGKYIFKRIILVKIKLLRWKLRAFFAILKNFVR